jgi:hypothetical protein
MAFTSIGIFSEYDCWTYHEGRNMSAGRAVIELRYAIQIARRYSLIELKLIEKRLFWSPHRRPIMVKHRTGASLLRRPFADLFALVFERTPSMAGWPQ